MRDLFFNTPARQKFQKSEATETANVSEAILRLALAHPTVHFRLRAGGRMALDLPPHDELGERVRAALARRGASVLHEAAGEEGGVRVRAFLAGPDEASTTPRSTFLFVGAGSGGGRFVRDRSLLHALAFGYGALLEKGRYPLATLFVDVPGQELDVNVHPQKLEVRFARPAGGLRRRSPRGRRGDRDGALARAGGKHARARCACSRCRRGRGVTPAPPIIGWRRLAAVRARCRAWRRAGCRCDAVGRAVIYAARCFRAARCAARARVRRRGGRGRSRGQSRSRSLGLAKRGAIDAPARPRPRRRDGVTGEAFFGGLTYIGQLDRTYLVCEGRDELVLVDQHAAHERVAFARLRAAHTRRDIRRQRLLFPLPVEVDEIGAALAADGRALEPFGFEVDGGPAGSDARTIWLRAVPEMLRDADPKPLLRDVLGQLADGGTAASALERADHVLATMACHSVVRAGDVLGREEVLALFAQLDGVDLRSHCPHGRPVLLRMPLPEIERRFGRL